MISFIPQFNQQNIDDAALAAIKSNNYQVDMDDAQDEFIFILDRSGSMTGSRMKMANQALIAFLKSLPSQCYFNIISFGSKYRLMFKESQQAGDEYINYATEKVEQFKADFGCTNLNGPLRAVYSSLPIKHVPKTIFLLTDGEVDDPDYTISLVKKHSNECRAFTMGVGNGASPYLVRQIAEKGRGKCEMILNTNDLAEKVIYLLDASMTPVLDDFTFEFDKGIVDFMTPGLNTRMNILKNEKINLFVFLNEKFSQQWSTEITMKYYNSIECDYKTHKIIISQDDQFDINDSLHKLGVNQIIQEMQDSLLDERNPDIYQAKTKDYDQQQLELSLQYQVLCKKTAFICKIAHNVVDQQQPKKQILIPNLVSHDYLQKQQQNFEEKQKQQQNVKVSQDKIMKQKESKIPSDQNKQPKDKNRSDSDSDHDYAKDFLNSQSQKKDLINPNNQNYYLFEDQKTKYNKQQQGQQKGLSQSTGTQDTDQQNVRAGQVKKGMIVIINGKPCRIAQVNVSKSGKHGHAKCHFTAIDINTNQKIESLENSTQSMNIVQPGSIIPKHPKGNDDKKYPPPNEDNQIDIVQMFSDPMEIEEEKEYSDPPEEQKEYSDPQEEQKENVRQQYSPQFKQMIQEMLAYDPEERLTIEQIMQTGFYQGEVATAEEVYEQMSQRYQFINEQKRRGGGGRNFGEDIFDGYEGEDWKIEQNLIIKPEDQLMEIIKLQKQKGYWIYNKIIGVILQMPKNFFMQNMPQKIMNLQIQDNQELENIWITILVLNWLNKNQISKKSTWLLLERKSLSWLKKRKIQYKNFDSCYTTIMLGTTYIQESNSR